MRVLVFHGYLLHGTGSNVYNARLCAALARQGHTVDLLSQERHPETLGFVGAYGTWEAGEPRVSPGAAGARVTAWRPDIGALLPVYVADRYEGLEARPYPDCTDAEIEAYIAANVTAVRDVVARARPDVALANHLIMGPLILARALGGEVPYAVKIHGSALEYAVKPHPKRFVPFAAEGLSQARTVLVGSRHTAESLWTVMADDDLPARTRLGPPGVAVEEFRPRPRRRAAAEVRELAARLQAAEADARGPSDSAFARDEGVAGRSLERLDLERDRHVLFVGKLIVSKGADLLAAAWPLVLDRVPEARLVVVGFGGWREAFERLVAALAAGDLGGAREIARAGRAAEGGPPAPLGHLLAFLDSLEGDEAVAYSASAAWLGDRLVLTGRLDHDELAPLLAAAEAQVVPSTFPEAYGMVAAEAAACGALPISAGHSGLAEVAAVLAPAVPAAARGWLTFPVDDGAVRAIADRVVAWLQAPEDLRAATRDALVAVARERFSWEGVAEGVIAAASGRAQDLPRPV
ncbi:MAG: glycosyl transferase group 1 [Solirubrobacterales bacterium]|jgi:glycosyltransferase involved in cell wall biosynthesis|nr:glycosyl transferase group 1 [Solirubrobacterales bacterium]